MADEPEDALELDLDRAPESMRKAHGLPEGSKPASLQHLITPKARQDLVPPSERNDPNTRFAPRATDSTRSPPAIARPRARPRDPFFTELGRAVVIPFIGKGAMWIPILAGVLGLALLGAHVPIVSRYARLLFFAYIGMLANYFARCADAGRDGNMESPELPTFDNFRTQFIGSGLAFLVLTALLFAPPVYLGKVMIEEAERPAIEAAAIASAARERARFDTLRYDGWDPNEVFLGEDGKLVQPKEGDPPRRLKRSDGSWVRVDPSEGVVTYEPKVDANAQPADAEPAAQPKPSIPGALLIGLLMALLLPFYYLPMALTTASFSEKVWDVFNPIKVLGAAFRGGGFYIAVIGVGLCILLVPSLIAFKLIVGGSSMIGSAVFLAGIGYACAVQGYLMGCLVSAKPESFPDFTR
jgi:hypothetical protein